MQPLGASAKKTSRFFLFFLLIFTVRPFFAEAQSLRCFDDLFPGMGENRKTRVFSDSGLILTYGKNQPNELFPAANSGITINETVMRAKPVYMVETLLVTPYSGRPLDRLDAYNALRDIRSLKGRTYNSFTRSSEVPLFEDATRIESARRTNPIPDPPPAVILPSSETIYIRLRDTNFGNSFYRGDITVSPYGVTCSLTNFRSLSYLLFTVMKEEKFSAVLYMEPLTEGMLIYTVAGADTSDFIANRIDVPSAISKRLAVFIEWLRDGMR